MTTQRYYAALLLLLAAACGPQVDAGSAPPSVPVTREAATDAAATADSTSPGFRTVLYSERDAQVTARTNGVVRTISAELGDAVSGATVLATLEDDREAAAVESAEATLDLAHSQRARAEALHSEQMTTQSDVDSMLYREKVAAAQVRDAHARFEYTRVRAPFAGRIAERLVRAGQTVREGDPLFRVTALEPLRAAVRVPEQQARALAPGARVTVRTLDGMTAAGRVARIAPAVDAASGTVELLVDVPQPGSIRPGSTVNIEIAAASAARKPAR